VDATSLARSILAELQQAASARDTDALLDLLTGDVVLFGTVAANLDRTSSEAYIQLLMAQDATIAWDWETVQVVDERPGAVTFVALGTVGLSSDPGRDPIRLTCLAVDDGDRWRLRHFHGSVPQA
jgi:ketosteroid isomerase-like protein